MLKEVASSLSRVLLVINAYNAAAPFYIRAFEAAAPALAVKPLSVPVRDGGEIERTIEFVRA